MNWQQQIEQEHQEWLEKFYHLLESLPPEMLKKLNITLDLEQPQPEQPKLERWKPKKDEFAYTVCSYEVCKYKSGWNTEEEKQWLAYNCWESHGEAKQEALRTRARRKLEWLARKLNEGKERGKSLYYISAISVIGTHDPVFYPPISCPMFYEKSDAEYALSQMTAEELEALR